MSVEQEVPSISAGRTVHVTVVLLFSAWLIDYADRLLITLALPAIGVEFDLSRGEQGLLVSAFFLAYAIFQIPGGVLADRLGARKMILVAVLVWSIFTAATGFAWSFAVLLIVRFLFGAAEGIFPPASMKVLVERTNEQERMSANGLIMSSNAIAAVLTPLAMTPLIAAFGWRSAFFSTAALGVLVLLAIQLGLPRPLARTTPRVPVQPPPLRAVLRLRVLWYFGAIMFGYNVIGWGLTTWVPTYLTEQRGIPLTSAGVLLAVPALATAVAVVIGGRLADRLEGNQRLVIVPGMTVSALALILMADSGSLAAFVAFASVAMFAASLAYMPIFAVPLRALPAEYLGVGSAVIIVGGQLAGMVTPPVVGVIADHLSFEVAFGFLVLGAVIAAVMAIITPQNAASFRAAIGVPEVPSVDKEVS
ncbi:MFS transporter [Nocardia sp. NPDC058633]|uniref:MFS transporter n=1 Tax=Nocardia sp. NPDC058633 TaxID=3346568 RepID=UPI00364672DC